MDRDLSSLVAEFDRAVVAWCGDPDRTVGATYTTRLLVERGMWEALLAEWRAATDDPVAARRVAWALTERGDRRGAERALDRAADLGDLPVLAARAGRGGLRGRAARARYERARERPLRADEQAAAEGEAVLEACRRYHERSQRIGDDREPAPAAADLAREALPVFTQADELGLAEGSRYLGWALLELKKLDRAEAALRRAVDGGDPGAVYLLARVLTSRRPPDWAGAERVYRQAIGRGLAEYSGLAECLEHLGDSDGAERAWQLAAEHESITDDALHWKRVTAQRSAGNRRRPGGGDASR